MSNEVIATIGEGGMGQVFRARAHKLNCDVALKVLPESFAHDRDCLARFTREAQTLASINHSRIGTVFELEDASDLRAIAMELLGGGDLSAKIARGAIPVDEALTPQASREIALSLTA